MYLTSIRLCISTQTVFAQQHATRQELLDNFHSRLNALKDIPLHPQLRSLYVEKHLKPLQQQQQLQQQTGEWQHRQPWKCSVVTIVYRVIIVCTLVSVIAF